MMTGGLKAFGLIGVLAMGACTAQGPTLNVQAEQMELALLECKAQLGLEGRLKTEVSFEGGVASAVAMPFDKISEADAVNINACANGATALNDGLLVVPMAAPAVLAAPAPVVEPTPEPRPEAHMNTPCPEGAGGMYAGTLYCLGSSR